jgi:hypothetical protein
MQFRNSIPILHVFFEPSVCILEKLSKFTTHLSKQNKQRKRQAIGPHNLQVFFAFGHQIAEFGARPTLAHQHQHLGQVVYF